MLVIPKVLASYIIVIVTSSSNDLAIPSLLCGFQIRNRFGARFHPDLILISSKSHPDFSQISSRFDSKSRNRFRDQIRKMSSEFGLKEFLTEI